MNAPVTYTPNVFANTGIFLFDDLWRNLAWVRHDKVPRNEYYVDRLGRPYTYGRGAGERTYESQPLVGAIEFIWHSLEKFHTRGVKFDAVFLNGYEDGSDHLGWHSDDSPEMDDARPIAIVTLGQEREIWFRERRDGKQPPGFSVEFGKDYERLMLEHASLCLMAPGMQDTHQHRIPKAGFQPCGPRVSLTFRGVVNA